MSDKYPSINVSWQLTSAMTIGEHNDTPVQPQRTQWGRLHENHAVVEFQWSRSAACHPMPLLIYALVDLKDVRHKCLHLSNVLRRKSQVLQVEQLVVFLQQAHEQRRHIWIEVIV